MNFIKAFNQVTSLQFLTAYLYKAVDRFKRKKCLAAFLFLFVLLPFSPVMATPFTETVPGGNGPIPSTYPPVGGTMVVLVGANGNIYYQFVNPSTQFQGFQNSGTPVPFQGNPFQLGPSQALNCGTVTCTDYFGGSIVEGYARLTARDGDACPGNFDHNNVFFRLNGFTVSSFTGPNTERTNMAGTVSNGFEPCFRNQGSTETSTAWFDLAPVTGLLDDILTAGSTTPEVFDTDPNDNYWYFRDGNDATGTPEVAPGISIEKSADVTEYNNVGDIINYTFVVKNIGSVELTNIVVTDTFITGTVDCGGVTTLARPTGTPPVATEMTCTGQHVVTQANLDNDVVFINTAEVTAVPTEGTIGSVSGTLSIPGPDIDPILNVTKVASKIVDAELDDIITYTYTVSNDGVLSIENVTVSDVHNGTGTLSAILGDSITVNSNGLSTDASVDGSIDNLAPGDSATFTATYTITQDDIDAGVDITNTATATGDPKRGTLTDPTANAVVAVITPDPEMSVLKATISSPTVAGETLDYTFTVTNTGNVTISNVAASDAKCASTPTLNSGGDIDGDNALDLDETWIYSCTSIPVTQAEVDAGSIDNKVSVSGTTPTGVAVTPAEDKISTPITPTPSWTLSKSDVSATAPTKENDIVNYSFSLDNTGNVSIASVVFTDAKCDSGTLSLDSGDTDTDTELDPTETWVYTCDHTVTQQEVDDGEVVNNASASGDPAGTATVPDAPATNTTPITPDPSLGLVKTAQAIDPADFIVGATVTYDYVVTNTGNVTITSQININDNLIPNTNPLAVPPDSINCDPWPAAGIPPTGTYDCVGTYTVTANDVAIGSTTNLATATDGTTTSPTDSETVPSGASPAITLTKSSVDTTFATLNQTLTYTYEVLNSGNAAFVADVMVSDDKINGGTPFVCWSATAADPNFTAGETISCTATYNVTQDDLDDGFVTNEASASTIYAPLSPNPTDVFAPAVDLTINAGQDPKWELTKTSVSAPTEAGQTVDYSFSLDNTGNVTISNVILSDAQCNSGTLSLDSGDTDTNSQLDVDEVWVYSCEHTVTQQEVDDGEVVNNASASGDPAGGTLADAPASNTITITPTPSWTLSKSDVSATAPTQENDIVNYSFSLDNTGNVSIASVVFTDAKCDSGTLSLDSGDTDTDTELDPTETWVYTCDHTVTQEEVDSGEVVNNASASGDPAGTATVPDAPATNTTPITPTPSWTLSKSDVSATAPTQENDIVNYSFSLDNTGNVSIASVVFTDAKCDSGTLSLDSGDADTDTELDPNETWVYTCDHTVTQDEVDAGEVVNNASASGDPAGTATVPDAPATNTTPITPTPSWTLSKSDVSATAPTQENDIVNYSFSLDNTGNVSIASVVFTDAKCDSGTLSLDSGDADTDTELDPNETWVYTCDHTVTQDEVDAGEVVNNASASGDPAGTATVPDAPATNTTPITPTPSWTLSKSDVSATAPTQENDIVNYSFSLDNTGNVSIASVVFTDAKCDSGTLSLDSGDADTDTELDPNETWVYTCDHTVTQDEVDAGEVVNNASASGDPAGTATVPDAPATNTTPITPTPSWTLSKSDVSATAPTQENDIVNYSFSLDNTGNVSIASVVFTDAKCDSGTLSLDSGDTDTDTELDPTETWVYTCDHTVTQQEVDDGEVVNNASASGDPAGTATVPDAPATNTTPITPDPSLGLVKTAQAIDPADFIVGATVTYDYVVTNTGNVTITSQININDNLIPNTNPLAVPPDSINCDPWPAAGIPPTGTYDCVGTYTVTANDVAIGSTTNLATATDGTTTSPTDSETVPSGASPAITLTKSSVDTTFATLNQTLTYTYEVLNSGNAAFVADVMVSDDKINGGTPFVCWSATAADPNFTAGETISCTATYNVTQDDLDDGFVTNEASASTIYAPLSPNPTDVFAPAVDLTISAGQDPKWELTKTSVSAPTEAGQTVDYSFSLDNTGNVTISNVILSDAQCNSGTLSLDSGDTDTNSQLDVDEVWVYSCEHTVTQQEVDDGEVVNNASASGDPAGGTLADAPASNTITIDPDPKWELTKSSSSTPTLVGQLVNYTFTLENTGNVTISNVTLDDPKCDIGTLSLDSGDTPVLGELAVDEIWTYSCDHSVTQEEIDAGEVVNNATASGTPAGGTLDNAPATNTLPIVRTQSWNLIKNSSSTITKKDDVAVYSFELENTGNVSITAVTLSDAKCNSGTLSLDSGDNAPFNVLDYDETWVFSCEHTVTQTEVDLGSVDNTATANGTTQEGGLGDVSNSNSIPVIPTPSLSVDKPAPANADNDGNNEVSEDDVLTYTITSTNTGNITLTDVVVSDPLIVPTTITCASVAPGATCVLTGTYTVTAQNVTDGNVVNTATADSDQTDPVTEGETTDINAPSLTVDKPAPANADNDGNTEVSEGDVLTYTITATNNGAATLTDVVVSDPLIVPTTITCASVAPGATCVLEGTYTVTAQNVTDGNVVNTATADSDQTDPVTEGETTDINAPSLTVDKPAPANADNDDNTEVSEGDVLTYTITATNNGAATLTDVVVSDPLIVPTTITCASVAPGATCVLTGTYTVTAQNVTDGNVVNTATADSDQTDPVTEGETTDINAPSLTVDKPAPANADNDGNTEVSEGDVLTYTITATNNGAATLTDVVVSDPLIVPTTITCASVAPGATCVLEGTYTVTAQNVTDGNVVNTATADSDQTDPVTEGETTDINAPSLTVDKPAPANADNDGNTEVSEGDVLTYTITATNNGAATLTDVVVSDPLIVPTTITCASVAPGATCVLEGTYTVTAQNVTDGNVVNTATADSDQTDPVTEGETTDINAPGLVVDKPAPANADNDGNTEVSEGDVLTYTITATNNGAATLTDVVVSDPLIVPTTITCASVAPGATCVLTGTYTVTAQNVTDGNVVNTATADSDQTDPVTEGETTDINAPSLTVDKPAPANADNDGNTEVSEGDVLTYTITATNNGAATLTDVVVSDPLIVPTTITCASVAPGATCVLEGTYTVTAQNVTDGNVVNTATADSDQTDPVTEGETTDINAPSLTVDKPAPANADNDGNTEVSEGDVLTYTITATNNGAATLTDVVVSDPLIVPTTITCASVAPGATCVLEGTYTVTAQNVTDGNVVNTATADSDQTDPVTEGETTDINAPSLTVDKPAPANADNDGNTEVSEGDVLTYTITATNNGAATLTDVVVSDPLIVPTTITCASVAPGATCVLEGTYTVTAQNVTDGNVVNTATADSDQTDPVTEGETTDINAPSLTVDKPAPANADNDGNTEVSEGDVLTYTITATNNGAATLTDVVVSDPLIVPTTITCASVAPGATCVLTGTYTVTAQNVTDGNVVNTATADSDQTDPVTEGETTDINAPSLTVDKPAPANADNDGNTEVSEGDVLTYTITATNNGAATLTDVVVSDPLIVPTTITCASVAPGATCVLEGTYTVTAQNVTDGNVVNTATADSDQTDPVTEGETTDINAPSLTVDKPAPANADNDGNTEVSEGDVLTYTITATNNGAATLTDVVVSDPLIVPTTITCASVAPGATCVLTGTYTVTAQNVTDGNVVNTATADSDQTDPVTEGETTDINAPSLTVDKPAPANADNDGNTEVSEGDVLTYTITATNNGAATLTDVVVSDPLIVPTTITCASVAPGATCVLEGTYTVTAQNVTDGNVVNTATADSDQTDPVTEGETTDINAPSLTVDKPAPANADNDGNTEVSEGDVLTYTITATNNGAATLTDVVVSDPLIVPTTITCASVAPGATCVLEGTYTVTAQNVTDGNVVNTATADSDQTDPVTEGETTDINAPGLVVDKPAPANADNDGNTEVSEGDVLTYTITATNNGAATLTDVVVSDPLIVPTTITCASVAPGATCVLTGTYTVTAQNVTDGNVVNTATADSDQTDPVTEGETTDINAPSLTVDKPAPANADNDGNTEVSEGDVLTYTITATNNGAATLTDVVVSDPLIVPTTITCASVAPGATCVLTGTYTVTAQNVTDGNVVNTATADSDQTDPTPATNTSSINQPDLTLVKPAPVNADNDANGEISEGDVLTYTVTATNNGTATLTNVVVTDNKIIPNTLTCATVAPSATCELSGTYTVTADDVTSGEIINDANVDSDQTDPTPATNTSSINQPDLTLVKPAPVNADNDANGEISEGDVLTYTVTATNNGTATLTNVVVTDNKIIPNTLTCATVAPSATCELSGTYTVTADDVTSGEIINDATADSDQTEQVDTNVSSSLLKPSSIINKSDPSNADNDGNGVVSTGDTLTYTITMMNDGTAALSNVIVQDPLITPSSITCGLLAPNATCVLTGSYVVQQSDIESGQIVNTATGSSNQLAPISDSVTTITANPEIRSSKSASEPRLNADGTFDIDFSIIVKNTGSVVLDPLTLVDDLGLQLGTSLDSIVTAPTITGNNISTDTVLPTANNSYTGIQSGTNLLTGTDGTLQPSDSFTINFTARINPNAENAPEEYANQATVGGSAGNLIVTDNSDNASNPDATNNDTPTSFVVPITNPELESTKFVGTPVINADLSFNVPFTIIVKNTGDVNLSKLTLVDNLSLSNQFGSAFISVVNTPISGISNNISGTAVRPTVNSNYTGDFANPNLLIGTDGFLAPNDEYTVNFVVKVNPKAAGAPSQLKNQSTTTASSPSGSVESDLSDAGNANGTNNSAPGDTGGSDDPTLLGAQLFVVPPAELLVSKVASKKQVSTGDLIPYTVLVKNKSSYVANGVTISDNLPTGFKIIKESIKVKTFDEKHKLLRTQKANTNGNDPIDIRSLNIPIEGKGYIKISYIVKVGTSTVAGEQCNIVQATNNASSNIARACVILKQNTVLDQSTLIGKVFHDRDGDGYQDEANVTGITVKSDYFGWNSLHLGGLNGRVSVLDDPAKHRKVIRMPLTKNNSFKVTTQQGTNLTVDNRGQVTESHVGAKAKGLSAQDLRVTSRRIRGIPTPTKIASMRKPAIEMDVLEISITNYGIQEEGIPGVRLATVKGLVIETDGYGRYHVPDVDGGRRTWGKNFIIKVDTATLPEGAQFTTENPRVLRLTGTALNKINFGVKLPVQKAPKRFEHQAAKYRTDTKTITSVRKVPVYKSVDVNLGSIFFDKDKHHIRKDQRGVMDDIANKIKQYGRGHITIDAYTDSRHTAKYNIVLAKRRAHSVRVELMKRLGNKLMRNVKVEVDPKALKNIPHNDPQAIDYKKAQ